MTATVEQPKGERRSRVLRSAPILLATHGLDRTDAALKAAWRLAKRFGDPLHVVAVVEPTPAYGAGDVALPMIMDEQQRASREADVRSAMLASGLRDDEWSLHIMYGSTGKGIAAAARAYRAGLIVLSANPHHRPWSTIAGERAVQVLRLAERPVLSVAPQWNGIVRRAVVAVDFSPPSLQAAQMALELLEEGGTLTLLHVAPAIESAGIDALGAAFERLTAMLRAEAPAHAVITSRVARGSVVERVLGVANEIGADLIAVGTHGPTLLERWFVGSTAAGVLHGAMCTVLASPPPSIDHAISLSREMGGLSSEDRGTWVALLNGVSARNAGRRVNVEIDDPSFGAQVQGIGLEFRGAAYDHHDRRVDLMLNDSVEGRGHLTRTIADVESIGLSTRPGGRDQVMQIRSGLGTTLVTFAP